MSDMAEKKVTPIRDEPAKSQDVVPFGELTARVASTFDIEPAELFRTLKSEFFPNGAASDAQMFLVLQILDKYKLNPFMHEIYAAVGKNGKLIVGVQYDGWVRKALEHPHYRGFKMERELDDKGKVKAVVCKVYRDDWEHPGEFYAAMDEWFVKGKDTWEQRPVHQLSIKAFNNCVKLTLGLTGIYDPDDVDRIKAAEDGRSAVSVQQRSIETTGTRIPEPTRTAESSVADSGGKEGADSAQASPVEKPDDAAHREPTKELRETPSSAVHASVVDTDGAGNRPPATTNDIQAAAQTRDNEPTGQVTPETRTSSPTVPSEAVTPEQGTVQDNSAPNNKATGVRAKLDHFISQHVTAARLDMLLGKLGVTKTEQLDEEQCAQLLRQLEKRGK